MEEEPDTKPEAKAMNEIKTKEEKKLKK